MRELRNNQTLISRRWICRGLPAVFLACLLASNVTAEKNRFTKRYVFYCGKWQSNSEVTDAVNMFKRASAAKYNGILVQGGQFPSIFKFPKDSKMYTNFRILKAEARRLELPLIPSYYHQLTASVHSYQSAEAFPVKETQYVISGGLGEVQPAIPVAFANNGFEDGLTGWKIQGRVSVDTQEKKSGNASLRVTDNAGYTKLYQRIQVAPFHAYELSMQVKTQSYTQPKWIGFTVKGKSYVLHFRHPDLLRFPTRVGATMNWKPFVVDFNSLDNQNLDIAIILSKAGTGSVWFDEIKIREVGLYECVRRSTTPVVVKSQTGTPYKEGTDYTISTDPEVAFGNQGILHVPQGSSIQEGEKLSVNWYQLANVENFPQPGGSGCHQEHWDYLRSDLDLLLDLFENDIRAWHIPIGEWREAGWDPACSQFFGTSIPSAGAYITMWTRYAINICKHANSSLEMYIKNDMYDPHHNISPTATHYYMANGSLMGAWDGIPVDAHVINWRPPKGSADQNNAQVKSMLFWGGLDPDIPIQPRKQLIRFNCEGGSMFAVPTTLRSLAIAESLGLEGVVGCVYNTWDSRYDAFSGIETFSELCKKAGYWETNRCPFELGCDYPISIREGGVRPGLSAPGLSPEVVVAPLLRLAKLDYRLKNKARVRTSLVSLAGREVRVLSNEVNEAGTHRACWHIGRQAAGVYFLVIKASGAVNQQVSRKIVLL